MRSLRSIAALLIGLTVVGAACVPAPGGRSGAPSPASVATGARTLEPTPSGPTPLPTFVRPTPTPLPTFLVHVVTAGDTLSSIARRYRTSPFSVAVWNRATYATLDPLSDAYDPNAIQAGWLLRLIPNTEVDEEDLLATSAPGGASAGPSREPGSVPSPTGDGAAPAQPGGATVARVVRHGPRGVPTVALTFDMGGRLEPAEDILAWLVTNEVPATVFPTGATGSTTDEGTAALDVLADHRDLLDVGNHSWSHPDFRDLDAAAMRDQLRRTEAAVGERTGRSTKPWFRPPYGGLDDEVPAVVGAEGWTTVVLWDIDTIDWRPLEDGGPTAAEIVAKVVDTAQGGSIVLMHLGGYSTLEALPGMVRGLRAKGLEPVTLGTMLGG